MTRAYPSASMAHQPDPRYINGPFLSMTNLASIKAAADMYAVQIEMTFRPDGLRCKFIKRLPDGSTNTKSVEFTNEQLITVDSNYVNSIMIQTLGGMNGFVQLPVSNKRTRRVN